MIERELFAYTAGMLESSGVISFRKDPRTQNSIYPVVIIKSPEKENLLKIKEVFGGSIIKKKNRWEIVFSHRKAEKILRDIYDFLLIKKKEADIIFQLYNDRYTKEYEPERKREIIKKMTKIKSFYQRYKKNGKSSVLEWLEE
ncbi:hypothetical protein [Persephonella sp.]